MFKKISIILLIQLLGLISACCSYDLNIKWIDFGLSQLDFANKPDRIVLGDSIAHQNFGLKLDFVDSIYRFAGLKTELMPAAYAFNCVPKFHQVNTAKRIQITTLTDLATVFQHPAS
jgi:hypothetical protein